MVTFPKLGHPSHQLGQRRPGSPGPREICARAGQEWGPAPQSRWLPPPLPGQWARPPALLPPSATSSPSPWPPPNMHPPGTWRPRREGFETFKGKWNVKENKTPCSLPADKPQGQLAGLQASAIRWRLWTRKTQRPANRAQFLEVLIPPPFSLTPERWGETSV